VTLFFLGARTGRGREELGYTKLFSRGGKRGEGRFDRAEVCILGDKVN